MNRIFAFNKFVVVKLSESLARLFVGLDRSFKKFIIDCFANFERINDLYLLLARRIQPIFEHHLNNHGCRCYV